MEQPATTELTTTIDAVWNVLHRADSMHKYQEILKIENILDHLLGQEHSFRMVSMVLNRHYPELKRNRPIRVRSLVLFALRVKELNAFRELQYQRFG